jgi:hypothetical protein
MKLALAAVVAVVAVLAAAQPAAAQQAPTEPKPRSVETVIEESGILPALDAVAATATPELERALGELASSLSRIAARLVADEELQTSTARAALGVAEVAEATLVEQSAVLRDLLRELADRLEARAADRKRPD